MGSKVMPDAPKDESIRTLYIGGIDWAMNEDLVRNKFKAYGEILSVALVSDRKCGFVTFGSRESAESAMNSLFDSLYLNQSKCQLNWAKSKDQEEEVEEEKRGKNEDRM